MFDRERLHIKSLAKFGCRNQKKQTTGKLMICIGDDKLDYRPFWEE
jgi:hypothetical protein